MKILSTVAMTAKKYAPELLLTAGFAGSIYSAVSIYRARPAIDKAVSEYRIENENVDLEDPEVDNKRLTNKINLVKKVVRAGGIGAIVGLGAMGCFYASYKIQTGRITTLSSSLRQVTNSVKRLKANVMSNVSDEVAKKIFSPTEEKTVVNVDDDGAEKTYENAPIRVTNHMDGFWLCDSEQYTDDMDYNMQFANSVISQLSLIGFNKNGLIMNEVFEAFDVPKTRQGALLGWEYDSLVIEPEVVHIYNEDTGQVEKNIYIRWSTPRYIYDKMSYDVGYFVD